MSLPGNAPLPNPAEAMGLSVALTVESGEIDLFRTYDEEKVRVSARKRIAKPSYVANFGKFSILFVPLAAYEGGAIAERWTLAGGPVSEILPDSVMNDMLGLRDGRWVFLMKKPPGEQKWPTVSAEQVGEHVRGVLSSR